jgi:hypothetical protein
MSQMEQRYGVKCMAQPKIAVSAKLCKRYQFRFPKSKKKRIRNKWGKRLQNFTIEPLKYAYRLQDGSFLCHPAMLNALRKYLTQEGYVGCLPITS